MSSADATATLSALFRQCDIPALLAHIRQHPHVSLYASPLPCGHTALQLASLLGAASVVRALLALGLRADAASVLHAATHAHVDVLRLLLPARAACGAASRASRACACAEVVPDAGRALHAAAWGASADAARALLDALCKQGRRNALAFQARDGAMPLHVGALSGDARLVRAMIEAGGDVWARDATEKTPKDWAKRYVVAAGEGEEVVRVLEEAERKGGMQERAVEEVEEVEEEEVEEVGRMVEEVGIGDRCQERGVCAPKSSTRAGKETAAPSCYAA